MSYTTSTPHIPVLAPHGQKLSEQRSIAEFFGKEGVRHEVIGSTAKSVAFSEVLAFEF